MIEKLSREEVIKYIQIIGWTIFTISPKTSLIIPLAL